MSDVIIEKLGQLDSALGRVEQGVIEMRDRVLAVEGSLSSLETHSRETAAASIRMATIAEERFRADQEERQARQRREEKSAEQDAELRGRAFAWFSENWKVVGLATLFLLNPASVGKMYELGFLAPFGLVNQPAMPAAPVHAPALPAEG